MTRLWARLRDLLHRERRSFLAGGRDVVETTRQSFLSLEARAGAALFTALWAWSLVRVPALPPYPFDPGPAFARLGADAVFSMAMFRALVLALHAAAGAVLGILLRNAWDLADELLPIPPRRAWRRRTRWTVTAGLLLFLHVGALLSAMRANPALYAPAFHDRGGPARLFQDWLATGWLSALGWLWTAGAFLLAVAGLVQMLRRFRRWFMVYPLPTRVASGVLGVGAAFFFMGLWGVFRFHRPINEGPNVVLIAAEGLRSADLKDAAGLPALGVLAHRGRTFLSCAPTVSQREAAIMTLVTGRSPLSHGVRHAFPAAADTLLDTDSLPVQLRRAGYETAVSAGAGGDLFGRLSPAFDRTRAPDLSVPGILRRDILRRSVHLLPYLRGRLVGRWLPVLRSIPAFSHPGFLAAEASGLLKQLRFERRFFLLVHMTGGAPSVDRSVGRILRSLDDLDLEASTWVVLWSPFAAPGPGEKSGAVDVTSPAVFSAPLIVTGPVQRLSPRWIQSPVRDVDVAPTVLSAAGLSFPDSMEGLPLLELDPDAPDFGLRDIYSETDLWTSPADNPLPPSDRLSHGAPSSWLEEDPETGVEDRSRGGSRARSQGRLRIRPSAEDAVLSYRHRLLQAGRERLVYRPGRNGVIFEYYDLAKDPSAKDNLAGTRPGAERVKALKEVLFQELRREAGWRPQNDFWIPEAIMRDKQ